MLTDPHSNSAADLVAKARAAKLGIPYLGRPTLDLDMSSAKPDPLDQSIADSNAPVEIEKQQNEPTAKRKFPSAPEELTGQPEATPRASSVVSDKRIAANKANAQRSTGPRTAEGKARASQNSLKHGLFSQTSPLTPQFCLPGEAELYAQTLANLTQSLAPHDPLELQLVARLAQLTVQQDRLTRFESSLLARAYEQALDWTAKFPADFPDPASPQHAAAFVTHAFTAVGREQTFLSHHQSRLSHEFARVLTQLRLTQKLRIQTQPVSATLERPKTLHRPQHLGTDLTVPSGHDTTSSTPVVLPRVDSPVCPPTHLQAPESSPSSEKFTKQTQPPTLPTRSHVSYDVGIADPAPPPNSAQTNPTPPQPTDSEAPSATTVHASSRKPHSSPRYSERMASAALAPSLNPLDKYETVIGLEVHVQLASRTKIFCSCPANFGSDPNTNVCPTCLALPGALPVVNRKVVEYGVKAGLALHCTINPASVFARKNYFYPDSPKGYQISQFDKPVAEHGYVDITTANGKKRIGVTRAHLEDDAGKSIHDGFRDSEQYTYVDLNRSGTPLIEIVSEPEMRSADEAYEYVSELKQMMEYSGVSNCDMEKGHLRFDANVSVRPWGQPEFGTRAEVKNLNSFKFLKAAIEYEVQRQVGIVESGGKVRQETRSFNPATGETSSLRDKEDAHDYRYFPEPDLLPLGITEAWLARMRSEMPEMPSAKRDRFISDFGLREYDAGVLTATQELSSYFEETAAAAGDPRMAANWVMGDLLGALKAEGKEIVDSPVTAAKLGELLKFITSGEISGKIAKDVFAKMLESGDSATAIIEREGLKQISDSGALEKIVDEIIAASPKQVEQYKGGKTSVVAYFVGQVMKASRGQANPAAVNEILKAKLG